MQTDELIARFVSIIMKRTELQNSIAALTLTPFDELRQIQQMTVAVVREELAQLDEQIITQLTDLVLTYVGRTGSMAAVSAILAQEEAHETPDPYSLQHEPA